MAADLQPTWKVDSSFSECKSQLLHSASCEDHSVSPYVNTGYIENSWRTGECYMWKSGKCSATPDRKRFSLQALLPSILPLLIGKEDGGGFWGSFPPGASAGEAMHLLWLGHKTLLGLFPHRLDGSRVLIWEGRVIEMITLEVLGRGVTRTHAHFSGERQKHVQEELRRQARLEHWRGHTVMPAAQGLPKPED